MHICCRGSIDEELRLIEDVFDSFDPGRSVNLIHRSREGTLQRGQAEGIRLQVEQSISILLVEAYTFFLYCCDFCFTFCCCLLPRSRSVLLDMKTIAGGLLDKLYLFLQFASSSGSLLRPLWLNVQELVPCWVELINTPAAGCWVWIVRRSCCRLLICHDFNRNGWRGVLWLWL
ncbi:hypothetical protein HII31_03561 [Pseudocercospora fuligena]|uniref:Uncharacterized protein n=1 Tax=Pseudocercospora fuligena TaxID=685502 RepID=A0A8H6RPT8_9PEZI|nr:hypothetical protein HII31_03561 [Pseudocercospora fuligena]